MNHPALFTPAPDPTPATHAATDLSVRPKVLRRPAHFSGSTASVEIMRDTAPITPPSTAQATAPTPLAWQDDGRFGLVMFVLIASINIGLILWLPQLHRARAPSPPEPVQLTATIEPSTGKNPAVTFYAHPDEKSGRTPFFQSLNAQQNTLSVSPADIPAPRAQPFDDDVETP